MATVSTSRIADEIEKHIQDPCPGADQFAQMALAKEIGSIVLANWYAIGPALRAAAEPAAYHKKLSVNRRCELVEKARAASLFMNLDTVLAGDILYFDADLTACERALQATAAELAEAKRERDEAREALLRIAAFEAPADRCDGKGRVDIGVLVGVTDDAATALEKTARGRAT